MHPESQNQSFTELEIIVVDNNSTDKTAEIAHREGARVYSKGPERSAQRNYGSSKARGEYLLFADADMQLTREVVSSCAREISKNREVKAVIIPEKSVGRGFWSACKALEREYYDGVDWMEAARFYEAKSFRDAGGFDESLTGPEDFDLNQRIKAIHGNAAVGRSREYILHDEGNIRLGVHLRKKYYYGKRMSLYLAKRDNKPYAAKQGSLFSRFALFFSKPGKLIKNPILGAGMLFLKTAETAALGLGYVLNSYGKKNT
jgi:glycosyltransferase involved in cell wall biosynthesis